MVKEFAAWVKFQCKESDRIIERGRGKEGRLDPLLVNFKVRKAMMNGLKIKNQSKEKAEGYRKVIRTVLEKYKIKMEKDELTQIKGFFQYHCEYEWPAEWYTLDAKDRQELKDRVREEIRRGWWEGYKSELEKAESPLQKV